MSGQDAENKDKQPVESGKKITLEVKEYEQLQAQAKEAETHLNRMKHVQADYENARKRLNREKAEFLLYANEELISKFLPIVDNFDRALEEAKRLNENGAFVEGVRMIRKQLEDVLTESGLRRVESVGKPFDTGHHEALAQVPSDDHSENTVVEEVQKGWFLHDRLLRPALVKVSSGKLSSGKDADPI